MNRRLIMLGTGHATVTRCYNTCFLIDNDGQKLLVDAGGGNGILTRLEQSHVDIREIGGVFVTHAHTDHLLGVVWVIRKAIADMISTGKNRVLNIHCGKKCAEMLRYICVNTLFSAYLTLFDEYINFVEIGDGSRFSCAGMELTAFDLHSDKMEQLGFRAVFSDGFTLICVGDEPVHDICAKYVRGCDMLMCEAFCLDRDAEIFRPYQKHHSTARDAAIKADELCVKALLLYHTEDSDLKNRKENYSNEARAYFSKKIFVPDDLDVIEF